MSEADNFMSEVAEQMSAKQNKVRAHPSYRLFKASGYKERETRNGVSFSGNILYKGKKAGSFENSGNGGPTKVFIYSDTAKDDFQKLCDASEEKSNFQARETVVYALLGW